MCFSVNDRMSAITPPLWPSTDAPMNLSSGGLRLRPTHPTMLRRVAPQLAGFLHFHLKPARCDVEAVRPRWGAVFEKDSRQVGGVAERRDHLAPARQPSRRSRARRKNRR